MSEKVTDSGREGPGEPARLGFPSLPAANRGRRSLWLLAIPGVLYCAAPVVANSIEPRILGVPFLLAWIIGASVVSPLIIWFVARRDPAYRADALEPIPADGDRPAGGAGERGGEPGAGAGGAA